ncbi:hypothetical protein FN976_11185 [Caenimonas sedimenti]|uniref:Uncharacterized protein n=1 Tax=Caenimonas sedimenti TaxID=2596921 RepID=A0A562ZSA2_9BURK|nr:hypothetical protein [Caenimonas sedimenti]TWO71472.1 hypothetical protein FN976_11185 [Caenimonas sedimenti]
MERLRQRFSLRLVTLLDALAYPTLLPDRAKKLEALLGIAEHDRASLGYQLLRGGQMPDYDLLLRICEALQREPGYFLDEHLADVPPGTRVVKPLGAGEELALRLPSDVSSPRHVRHGLVYHRTRNPMGFAIPAGAFLIALAPTPTVVAEPGRLYLFSTDEGFDVRRCRACDSGRATFVTEQPADIPLIVPTSGPAGSPAKPFSLIVAILLDGKTL